VEVAGGPAPIELKFDYEDGWFFSAGGEFDVTSQVTLRAGVGYELSPIDDNSRTYRLPYNDGGSFAVGGSYRYSERLAFDLGYSLAILEDMDIRPADEGGPAANGPFSGHADDHAHYISAAIRLQL
jgi:long-chain fatty acid transport protein